uniref:Uncharacterized protein n=1 Tax=Glossina austeni TaxID=7395 RepID=A0A1A9UCS0_GLOAU
MAPFVFISSNDSINIILCSSITKLTLIFASRWAGCAGVPLGGSIASVIAAVLQIISLLQQLMHHSNSKLKSKDKGSSQLVAEYHLNERQGIESISADMINTGTWLLEIKSKCHILEMSYNNISKLPKPI